MRVRGVCPRVRGGVVLATLGLATGCVKQVSVPSPQPAPHAVAAPPQPAPAEAPPPQEPQAEPTPPQPDRPELAFTSVSVRYSAPRLTVAYAVHNRGTKRARAGACLEVLDAQGFLIGRLNPGDFSLRAGDSDELEETVELEARAWAQAWWLRLYAGEGFGCHHASTKALGPVLHLDLAGQPLPPGTAVPGPKPEEPLWREPGSPPVFALEDVQWGQVHTGMVTVSYTVRNLAPYRASGSLCVRLYAGRSKNEQSLAHSTPGSFNLAPGASERSYAGILLDDESVWDRTRKVRVYASRYGCADPIEEAWSAVLTVNKPAFLPGPPAGRGASKRAP